MIFTLPNFLSLLRIPLAFFFLQDNIPIRMTALIVAGLTDGLDGFIARKYGQSSRLGTILDPFTDKFFVLFVLAVFYFENRISLPEIFSMMSRDFAVLIFGGYLMLKGMFGLYKIEAFWVGKIFTALQLFVLLMLILGVNLPEGAFGVFVVLGVMSLAELSLRRTRTG